MPAKTMRGSLMIVALQNADNSLQTSEVKIRSFDEKLRLNKHSSSSKGNGKINATFEFRPKLNERTPACCVKTMGHRPANQENYLFRADNQNDLENNYAIIKMNWGFLYEISLRELKAKRLTPPFAPSSAFDSSNAAWEMVTPIHLPRDMPEDRMDKRTPPGKPGGKPEKVDGKGSAHPHAPDTKMVHDTVTPDENDPAWDQLGATRVSDGQSDSSGVNTPANFTEMSPSQVLGKNLKQLGEFKLGKKLGEGAMGAVYKAEQPSFGRIVALKVLFPHVAANPKLVARLRREAEVMFELDHPNIVRSFAIDEAEGFHYVAMEYVSGQSMQKWLTQLGRLPVADAVRITLDCANALAYAHRLNMVHRDIKPDNILLTKTGFVKVADLGMVKIDDEEMSLTQTGHAVGTPWFMPLEQARNAKEIDGRSDIYALGCTLYAFLTGRPPFMGRTIVDVIQAKEVGTIAPARQSNSDVPERLDLILIKMTAKHPKNRYQTCDEMIKDLESLGLASTILTFLSAKPAAKGAAANVDTMAKTTVTSAPMKSRADVDFAASAAPALDLDQWYVQMKMPDGEVKTRKYTTVQLLKMLTDGTVAVTARGSHTPNDNFRALSTFKEFQGIALGKMTKKAADKNTARTRGLFKRIEEGERQREAEEDARKGNADTAASANMRYWGGLAYLAVPIVLVVLLFVGVLYASSAESGWGGNWWAPLLPGIGLLLYSIHWFFFGKR